MVVLHLKEEMKAQMATLDAKTRELEARLQETKDFTMRLSRLVVKVVEGYMQQSQELSFIKFLLTAVLFRSGGDVPGALYGPDVPPGGPGPGGPTSISTSDVSRWLDSTLRDTSPPSSPVRPPTPDSEVSFGAGNSYWTAVSPLSSLGEVEEGHRSGLLVFGGGSGDHGGVQGIGGGVGTVLDNGISQFAWLCKL